MTQQEPRPPTAPPSAQLSGQLSGQLSALLALLLGSSLLCAGAPGLGLLSEKMHSDPKARAALARDVGPLLAPAVQALATFNARVRLPLSRRLLPPQQLFRVRQSWHLYGAGEDKVMRLEIHADDQLLYRSEDPRHAWRADQLGHRRVRPMVKTMMKKSKAFNWRGFAPFVVDRVRQDHPGVRQVGILALHRGWTDPLDRIHHGRVARAPDWRPIFVGADGVEHPEQAEAETPDADEAEP